MFAPQPAPYVSRVPSLTVPVCPTVIVSGGVCARVPLGAVPPGADYAPSSARHLPAWRQGEGVDIALLLTRGSTDLLAVSRVEAIVCVSCGTMFYVWRKRRRFVPSRDPASPLASSRISAVHVLCMIVPSCSDPLED